jgi:hypothetical protein
MSLSEYKKKRKIFYDSIGKTTVYPLHIIYIFVPDNYYELLTRPITNHDVVVFNLCYDKIYDKNVKRALGAIDSKGSITQWVQVDGEDADVVIKQMVKEFKDNFIMQRTNLGKAYFEGDYIVVNTIVQNVYNNLWLHRDT